MRARSTVMWYVMWSHIPLSPASSLPLPLVVIHQLIWRKRWPGSPVMWFAIACFLLFTKVLWIEAFSVHKCSVLSYLWHENNKSILFSTWYCVSAVIKFHAVLTNNVKCESNNWKMKRNYLQALLETSYNWDTMSSYRDRHWTPQTLYTSEVYDIIHVTDSNLFPTRDCWSNLNSIGRL